MNNPDNTQVDEILECLVCAMPHKVVIEYTPDGKVVDCIATRHGGHCIPDETRPLIACDFHSPGEIISAYNLWKSRMDEEAAKNVKTNE